MNTERFDFNNLSPKERRLYDKGLLAFSQWMAWQQRARSYRWLFVLSLVGNVVQWWISR